MWVDRCSPVIRHCTLIHNYSRNDNYQIACPWDLDGDQDVDVDDLEIFSGVYGERLCTGQCTGDYDTDNDQDAMDLAMLALAFGNCQ